MTLVDSLDRLIALFEKLEKDKSLREKIGKRLGFGWLVGDRVSSVFSKIQGDLKKVSVRYNKESKRIKQYREGKQN